MKTLTSGTHDRHQHYELNCSPVTVKKYWNSFFGRLWGVRSTFCPSVHVDTAALNSIFRNYFQISSHFLWQFIFTVVFLGMSVTPSSSPWYSSRLWPLIPCPVSDRSVETHLCSLLLSFVLLFMTSIWITIESPVWLLQIRILMKFLMIYGQ